MNHVVKSFSITMLQTIYQSAYLNIFAIIAELKQMKVKKSITYQELVLNHFLIVITVKKCSKSIKTVKVYFKPISMIVNNFFPRIFRSTKLNIYLKNKNLLIKKNYIRVSTRFQSSNLQIIKEIFLQQTKCIMNCGKSALA